jgi:hypothetical protein
MSQKTISHYEHLKHQWTKKHERIHHKLLKKHEGAFAWLQQAAQQLTVGSLASIFMLTTPTTSFITQLVTTSSPQHVVEQKTPHTKAMLIEDLHSILPSVVQPLTDEQNQAITAKLTEYFNIPVYTSLEEKRLDRTYGLIGQEQHLMRYPGDTIETHFETAADAALYAKTGMAPGRGAWGYFAQSGSLTKQDIEREKYYIAVQTFLAPGWHEHANEYYKFFKFRKMVVINPENGKAVVVVIGDSGPAEFTGKHLGGSPEVMTYLERKDGAQKGPVLYYFIDDPDDKVPLGPIQITQ